MALQWTVVTGIMGIEIVVLILLLQPWIPLVPILAALRLAKEQVGKLMSGKIHPQFLYGILILFLGYSFLDSVQRVWTNSNFESSDVGNEANKMKRRLYKAQRNACISGFAIFLGVVINRMEQLLIALADSKKVSNAASKKSN